MEVMLTAQEVADLEGCKPRYIRQQAKNGDYPGAVKVMNELNRPCWLIPLPALDTAARHKYFEQLRQENSALPGYMQTRIAKPLDIYTEAERNEIMFWLDLIDEWQSYRHREGANMTVVDAEFESLCKLRHPDRALSIDTLYRRQRAIRDGDYDGLIDQRGKHKAGTSSIPEIVWQAFLSFYLDQAQHPISRCYEYTKLWVRAEHPELGDIQHHSSFRRRLNREVPEPVKVLGREGEKAFDDRCAPYIRRVYDDMASNEWWVADNHTFDIITQGPNGQQHRLYLTAFFDARSGIFVGCHVTTAPSSQSTLIALRKAILKHGLPANFYVDNGREFLTFDIGGLGHRQKKSKDGKEQFTPPPVLKRLGINMTNAIVRNAKAKIIERRFLDIKNQLSRLFDTFTGGNVLEKPEKLKGVLKNGEIPLDGRLTEIVEELLDWYFNQQEYGGAVAADRGKNRMQVYNENLVELRTAKADELNLMLMRSARPQKVTRRGVHLDIAGERIDYWNDDMLMNLLGKQVYFRYDPDNLSEARIYDLEDRFIMTVPADNEAVQDYNANADDLKVAMSKVKSLKKKTKAVMEASVLPFVNNRTALELVLGAAHENKTARIIPSADPKVIQVQRAIEEPLLKEAVGFANLDVMNKNAMKKQGGNGNE